MKQFILICISLSLVSCANRYGVFVGGQKATYSEENNTVTVAELDGSLYLNDFQLNGNGFHFGISEESKFFITKIAILNNSYKEDSFVIDNEIYETKLDESGLRLTFGPKIYFFQPYISLGSYVMDMTINSFESEVSYGSRGYGFDVELSLSKSLYLYLGYSEDKFENSETISGVNLKQDVVHRTVYAGLRYNFSDKYTKRAIK